MRVAASSISTDERTREGIAVTELILQIFRTNGRLLRAGDALSRDFGLTSARWQVLGAISERPKTVAQIGREFELSRQGILWVVQALRKDGMITLIRNPDHKRAKLVTLTDEGRAALMAVLDRQHRWSDALGVSFTQPELEACKAIIARLGDLLAADEDIEPDA